MAMRARVVACLLQLATVDLTLRRYDTDGRLATSTVLRGSLRSAFNARSPAPSPQIRFGRWTPERPTVKRPVPANGGTVVARTGVVGFFALGCGSSPTPSRRVLPRAPSRLLPEQRVGACNDLP